MTGPSLARWRTGFRPFSYDRRVFSPRVRSVLPSRYLTAAGIPAEMVPAEAGNDDVADRFDCVVFQKAYTRADLALAERLVERGRRVVFDLCDNHFYNPAGDPELAKRAERLREMLPLAHAITVSSPTLAVVVADLAGIQATVVDDALEVLPGSAMARRLRQLTRPPGKGRRGRLRLVWQGQVGTEVPPSGLVGMRALVPILERLDRTLPLSLTVISNSRDAFDRFVGRPSFPARYLQWRPATFPYLFTQHDVYVLPVDANPFTVAKTANRVVLSLLLGVPVVADEIPSYRELGEWMLFDDWETHVRAYRDDSALVERHVQGAQTHIRSVYTPERVVEQWSAVLRSVLG